MASQVKHFRFLPQNHQHAGLVCTVLTGEVEPGKIYPFDNPEVIKILAGHKDWEESTKAAFNAQRKESQ